MKVGLSAEAEHRADDMVAAVDRLTAAIEANTAAVEAVFATMVASPYYGGTPG